MEASLTLLCDSYICRLCAQENNQGASLFSHEGNQTDLSQLVNKYLPLKVQRDGKFPILICPGCKIQLEATRQFLDLILAGQRRLLQLFQIQQETLQRQEKQKQTLEAALKSINSNGSVSTYTIESDESGEKFIIQILSDGPVFSPDHELSLQFNGTEKPKRKRGRPQKSAQVATDKSSTNQIIEIPQVVRLDNEIENDVDVNGDETRRKRKIKVPSRYQEAVQGKELDRIFKEEGVIDDESDSETFPQNQLITHHEEEVIGRLQNKEGEDMGELVIVSKHPNKIRTKGRQPKKKYMCELCGIEFVQYSQYCIHKAMHNVKYECAEANCHYKVDTVADIEEHQLKTGHTGMDIYEEIQTQGGNSSSEVIANVDKIIEDIEISETDHNNIEYAVEVTADSNSQDSNFLCEICSKTFASKQNYEVHCNAIHKSQRPHECTKCDKSFAYINSLRYHMLQHTDSKDKLYMCDICEKAFNHPSSLVYHREAEHNNGRRFVCNKCTKSFKHKQLLHRHQLVHSEERPYGCKFCKASFKTRANLFNHMPLHTGEKKYFCLQCGQSFAHRTSLTLHIRWHNGQKPYQCDICMKTFSQKGNLAEHKRIHTGEKPYNCGVCGRKFTTSSQCKLHMMRHTGERPWRCEYCAKSFLHKDTWKCHTRRHRNERPFQCQQCYRGFTEQWALKKHERLHTGERPYICDVCKKDFADCSNLTKHKKTHEIKTEKVKPKNIKIVTPASEGNDEQVVYLTYQDSDSADNQMQTLVHIVDESSLVEDNFITPLTELQHFIDENGKPISLTTADGHAIKVLSIEQNEKCSMPSGILLPITDAASRNNIQSKSEENLTEEHVLKGDIQFINEDYTKLDDDIQFLTEDGICFVASYNIDENINTPYM